MTSTRLPDLVGRRKDVLDQRETDRSASRLLPLANDWFYSIAEQTLGSHRPGTLAVLALVADLFQLTPLRSPEGPIKAEQARVYVSSIVGAVTFEMALYNYLRDSKTFTQVNGSYAKWTLTGTGLHTTTVKTTIGPSSEPMAFGFRRTGGTTLTMPGITTNAALARSRNKTLTGAFPRRIEAGAIPFVITAPSAPDAAYLSNRMINVL